MQSISVIKRFSNSVDKYTMNLAPISKYRSELMGFATLWVMLFHFRSSIGAAPLDWLSSIGDGGVDIFLFLSGLGLYCSYAKDSDTKRFYYKRFLRIYPIYLFIIAVNSILKQDNVFTILLKSTGIGFFLPIVPNSWYEWYVPSLFLLYLVFPLVYKLLNISCLKCGGG